MRRTQRHSHEDIVSRWAIRPVRTGEPSHGSQLAQQARGTRSGRPGPVIPTRAEVRRSRPGRTWPRGREDRARRGAVAAGR